MEKHFSQRIHDTVDRLRPIDDSFFTLLSEDKDFCREVLSTILEMPELVIIQVETQKEIRNIEGRSVRLDVLCKDANDRLFNIEVQKDNNDNHEKRVRYNGSNIDTLETRKGTSFCDLPDVYVIYISTFDYFKKGKTIYHIDRVIRETNTVVDNGFYEIYVNTEVYDGSNVSELMNIFKSSDVIDNPLFPNVCKAIKNYKLEKGREDMCDIVKEFAEDYAKDYAKSIAKKLFQQGNSTIDEIVEATGLTKKEVLELVSE